MHSTLGLLLLRSCLTRQNSLALSALHCHSLQVPFTLRKHTLLLPVFAELLLGQFSFSQVLQQVRDGSLLLIEIYSV